MTNHENHHHVLPLKVYLTIGAILLVLTTVTVVVASFDLGPLNLIVAMAIAAIKGTLVVLYFMHLRYDSKMYSLIFGAALFFLATFIIITMFDTLRRDDIYDIRGVPVSAQAVIYTPDSDSVLPDSLSDIDTAKIEADQTVTDSINH